MQFKFIGNANFKIPNDKFEYENFIVNSHIHATKTRRIQSAALKGNKKIVLLSMSQARDINIKNAMVEAHNI